jgi:hypothetical protein
LNNLLTAINNAGLAPEERLAALKNYVLENYAAGQPAPAGNGEINNHIHTIYSFSPYTPSMAALKAAEAGLEAAGSVDHDSCAAADEMNAACAVLGIGGCCGFEVRVSFKDGPFAERKLNNPDSKGIAYMTVQGVPAPALKAVAEFLKPIRAIRLERGKKMAEAANALLAGAGAEAIDFEKDVVNQSQYKNGGEVTERHLVSAAAEKLIAKYGKGKGLCAGLVKDLGLTVSPRQEKYLSDPANPHYLYDVLGILKTDFLSRIFIQPSETECIKAKTVVDFALSVGAIPAYAYLGDVGESPTGDKKAEKFEDDFLPELMEYIKKTGYRAFTYMPPRNTPEQIRRVQKLCAEWGFMEISGVDINSSRQSFNCPEVLRPDCRHLVDTTWALIAHERLASADKAWSLFAQENPLAALPLAERLALYAKAGKSLDRKNPDASVPDIIKSLKEGRK